MNQTAKWKIKKPQPFNNLTTKGERTVLQRLSEKGNIVITKVNKRGAVAITGVKEYTRIRIRIRI